MDWNGKTLKTDPQLLNNWKNHFSVAFLPVKEVGWNQIQSKKKLNLSKLNIQMDIITHNKQQKEEWNVPRRAMDGAYNTNVSFAVSLGRLMVYLPLKHN